ncbi:MAG: TOBE domain-containing protein [Candidatus Wallbacteria bacterium]|nr:TOBE domain-containing protein [Candidatus Wallbacteria bacterium]
MKRKTDHEISLKTSLQLKKDNHEFLGNPSVLLLEKIAECGSITKAAKAAGISYKTAWDTIDRVNNLSDEPLVESSSGGSGGGGTRLTGKGLKMVTMFRQIETEQQKLLDFLRLALDDFDESYQFFRKMLLKTSARNLFYGTVSLIKQGTLNAEVVLSLKGGDSIAATITNQSLENLRLKIGDEACGLVKASWVILTVEEDFQTSARNIYRGIVEKIMSDGVNSEVILKLPGGNTLTAAITDESVKNLGIRTGSAVTAMFKASSVIIGSF